MISITKKDNIKNSIALVLGFVLFQGLSATAGTLDGVTMPDQKTVSGKTLQLNGMGTRKATLFKVKVYVGGLYLQEKSKDADEILDSKQIKQVHMEFLRDVEQEKIKETWKENYEKNCRGGCYQHFLPKFEKFLSYLGDVKTGETTTYNFLPEGLQVITQNKKHDIIEGEDFSRIILSAWLGPEPQDSGLKKGLLGVR